MASDLKVSLSVIDKATATLNKVSGQFDAFGGKITSSLKKTALKAGAAFAGMFAINSLKNQFADAMKMADNVRKMADQWGMATEEAQKWDYVARMNKTSGEALKNGFGVLSQRMYEYTQGTGEARKVFDELGISVTDTNGNLRKQGDVIKDVVKALADETNETKRNGMAQKMLGESGKNLATILKQGSGAIEEQLKAAEDYNQVLSESSMKKLEATSDALSTMNQAFKVGSAEIMASFAPAMDNVINMVQKMTSALNDSALAWSWWLGGEDALKKRQAEITAIQKEIIELGKLKQERQNVVDYNESLKAKNLWYNKGDLEDAKNDVDVLVGMIKELNLQSQGIANPYDKFVKPAVAATQNKKPEQQKTKKAEVDNTQKQILDAERNLIQARLQMIEDADERELAQLDHSYAEKLRAVSANEAALTLINEAYMLERDALEAKVKERKAENDKKEKELQLEFLANSQKNLSDIRISLIEDEHERELALLESKYTEKRIAARDNADALLVIDKAYALERESLENEVTEQKRKQADAQKRIMLDNLHEGTRATSANLNTMAQEWKGFGGVYKAIAIATASWDTFQAANASYKAMAGVPFVGPALGAMAATAAIGAGLANVNQIRKTKFASGTNFASGGLSLIGEQGPELMYTPRATTILNNRETKQLMNNSTIVLQLYDNNKNQIREITREISNGNSDEFLRTIKKRLQVI